MANFKSKKEKDEAVCRCVEEYQRQGMKKSEAVRTAMGVFGVVCEATIYNIIRRRRRQQEQEEEKV